MLIFFFYPMYQGHFWPKVTSIVPKCPMLSRIVPVALTLSPFLVNFGPKVTNIVPQHIPVHGSQPLYGPFRPFGDNLGQFRAKSGHSLVTDARGA